MKTNFKNLFTGILLLVFTAIISSSYTFKSTSEKALLPTALKITVLDELGNYVESAEVTIYGNEEDFKASENAVMEMQLTDKKGRVTFKGLEPKSYYVDVVKGKKTNYGAAQLTPQLEEGRFNKVNIIIE